MTTIVTGQPLDVVSAKDVYATIAKRATKAKVERVGAFTAEQRASGIAFMYQNAWTNHWHRGYIAGVYCRAYSSPAVQQRFDALESV